MIHNDYTAIYLGNTLQKMKNEVQSMEKEMDCNTRAIEGLSSLLKAYQLNPLQGDPETIKEV